MVKTWEIILRLLLAAVFGGVVGYQREIVDRPAGFRTHVLVCTGSALMMMVSIYPFTGFKQVDLSRIAAGVVTGIGFLGAGTIIRQGSIVRGLTTAASLWTIAGVGLAVGSGFYLASVATTVLVFVVLAEFKLVETHLIGTKRHKILKVKSIDWPGQIGKISTILGDLGISIKNVEIIPEGEGKTQVRLLVDIPKTTTTDFTLRKLMEIKGVVELGWEEY